MDYMTELAASILDAVGSGNREQAADAVGDLLRTVNGIVDVEFHDERDAWNTGSRAERLEILTDVLYGHADTVAAPAARSLGYPTFIAELALRTLEILNSKKRTLGDRVQDLFHRSVHRNLTNVTELRDTVERARQGTVEGSSEPAETLHLDGLMDLLIRDASLVNRVAELVQAAVPFSVMLSRELDEIDASRKTRYEGDDDSERSRFTAVDRHQHVELSARLREARDIVKDFDSNEAHGPAPKRGDEQ